MGSGETAHRGQLKPLKFGA